MKCVRGISGINALYKFLFHSLKRELSLRAPYKKLVNKIYMQAGQQIAVNRLLHSRSTPSASDSII